MSGLTEGRETAPQSFRVERVCWYRRAIVPVGEIITPETYADHLDARVAHWLGEIEPVGDNPDEPEVIPDPPDVNPEPPIENPEQSPVPPMTTQDAPTRAPVRPPMQRPRGRR
jgi:hypothetical protein